jgi:hypothetical protein
VTGRKRAGVAASLTANARGQHIKNPQFHISFEFPLFLANSRGDEEPDTAILFGLL